MSKEMKSLMSMSIMEFLLNIAVSNLYGLSIAV